MRKSTLLAMACAAPLLALSLTACGSDDSSGNAKGEADVTAAKALIEGLDQPMTDLGLPKLTKAPEKGQRLVFAGDNTPAALSMADAVKEAGKALGWEVKTVAWNPAPADILKGWDQVLALDPDLVATSTQPVTSYEAAAKELAKRGVPVVTSNTDDEATAPVIANAVPNGAVARTAELVAGYIVAQSGADANVVMFNIPDFPILRIWQERFEKTYKDLCPSCDYEAVKLSATDIGTKAPEIVTSAAQRNPKMTHAVMGFGDVAMGVAPALKLAGFDNVKITGISPSLPNVQALIDGTEEMWVAMPLATNTWRQVDGLVRHVVGDDASVVTRDDSAVQIMTKENVGTKATLPELVDHQAKFKELWNVG